MKFDNFLEKVGGPLGREVCHENFTGESSSIKLMKFSEVANFFPEVKLSKSDYIAYLPATMCRSLPVVNKRGRCFTPRVMSKSAASAQHGLVDVEHVLKDNAFKRDMIVGHIAAVRFGGPTNLAAASELPLVPKEAMPLDVLLALYMRTDDVPRILEEHLTGQRQWANSMECYYQWPECAFYYEGEFIPVKDAPEDMLDCVEMTKVNPYKNRQLAVALGGMDNAIDYCGIGLTTSPADSGSEMLALLAGRDMASSKRFYPVKAMVKTGLWKNPAEAVEIANTAADENFKQLAAIEVLGQTEPAEDGHVHDVLTDGTIVPASGHTHYTTIFQLVRGTNPRYTGRTSEQTIYPVDTTDYRNGVTHLHLMDIPLRGGKKPKDSTESQPADVASVVDSFNSLEESMASKFSELFSRLEKAMQVSPVKSEANKGEGVSPEVASILVELRQYKMDDDIKEAAQKQIADEVTAGTLVKKEEVQKQIDAAVKVKEDELVAKHNGERVAAEKLAKRLDEITKIGVSLDFTPEGEAKTLRDKFSSFAFDATGDALYAAEFRALKAQAELEKERAAAKLAASQPKVEEKPLAAAANDGKKPSFLIGGATATETASKPSAMSGKSIFAKYGSK